MKRAGQILSFGLLGFAFALFYLLFISRDTNAIAEIDSRVWGLLYFTLYQAFLSTALSLVVGVLLAWSLVHTEFKAKGLLVALFSSSLVLPTLVVVFGLIAIYGRNGWINVLFDGAFGTYLYGLFGILLAHVYLNASYASRTLLHAFEAIPLEKYKLAKSLGLGLFKRFWLVEFPAIKSTLMGIGATIFLLCFTSFAIVLVLGGSPTYNTLEVAIYEAVRLEFDIDMALKLAWIQLSISTILVILSSTVKTDVSNLTQKMRQSWKEPLIIRTFQVLLILLFALFFISPLLAIMIDGVGADFAKILGDSLFIKSFITSIVLASISATLTLLFALALSDARRRSKGLGTIMISFSGNLYLAIPSLVLGLGFFLLSQRVDISQTVIATIALITANVLMALPFALSILSPIMIKTARRYDKLATSLGIFGWQRYKEIELPYLKPAMAYVFALAFCFSLGDLGIIALFGSESFSTLPWYLYGLLGSYRTSDAAGVALVMLVLVLAVFILVPRVFKKRKD
jgi:thiamine transport system permease protein